MTLLIIYGLISLVGSFLCSIWEAVLLSITPSYAETLKQTKPGVAKLVEDFKGNVDRPLSAILTLNTIAHTVGAILVGGQATDLWGKAAFPFLGFEISVNGIIVPGIMTLVILILSEIIPKTLGANYWKSLTPFTIRSLNFVIMLLSPLVWFSQQITKKLKKNKGESVFSRADFTAMARIGTKEGVIEEDESNIIMNLLKFKSVKTTDIMTPRTVVKAAAQDDTIKDFYQGNQNLRFSRIPIYDQTKDNITGFFLKDEMLQALINDKGAETLSSIKRNIMIVNESFPLPELFNRFLREREHIALVVDEFGGMAGIVSMEDAIETLLGMEIVDELDSTTDMQALARKNWQKRAKNLGIIEE